MGAVVDVEQLGKRYRLGELGAGTTLREAVTTLVRPRRRAAVRHLWALRDVSFTLDGGDTLGVVGRNGSGKSTLLRILARITEPTTGVSRTRGRVASLLEIGTGFHEELTGRDNIALNGAVHGMTRRDIAARFDDIVDFADIGPFLDTPLKRYSTGMHLRLAFSIGAHLDPDVLIVDEVLAVGDLEFQRRCLGRMQEAGRAGRAVVFVSHDLAAVARLCRRAVWLDGGIVRDDGPTAGVLDAYSASFVETLSESDGARVGPVTVRSVRVLDPDGRAVSRLGRQHPFDVEVAFGLDRPCPRLDLAVYLTDADGIRVLDEAWSDHDHAPLDGPGDYRARVRIPPVLTRGDYRVGLWIGTEYEDFLDEPVAARLALVGGARRPDRVLELDLPWTVTARRDGPGDRP